VAIVATLLGLVVLGLVGNMSTVPVTYSADGILHSVLAKGIVDHGQFYVNPNLGAPGVFEFYDFPAADGIFVLEFWLLSLFTNNYVLVLNLFALLSYPLIALSATWAIRRLGFSRASSFVFGLLYALLPYHQSRISFHLYLAAYFAVPLAVALVAEVGFGAGQAESLEGWWNRRLLGVPVWGWIAAVIVGTSGVYYAFFCFVLMLLAGLLRAFANGGLRGLYPAFVVCAAIVAVLAMQYVPSFIYWQRAGHNSIAQQRVPSDSDLYALRMTELVFPMTNHRLAAFASIKSLYLSSLAGITEKYRGIADDSSLGLVGVMGFFVLLFWAVASPLRGPPHVPDGVPSKLAIMALGSFLLATVGGVGEIIAYLGFPQIRAYERITVYLGFLSLCAAAWVADTLARRIASSGLGSAGVRRGIVVACFAAVLLLGFLDQTSPAMVPDYAKNRAVFESDRVFVERIESVVPNESSIFQLPYVQFPEGAPVGRTGGYDELRMYLHSENLRWSAGAFMGRADAQWQAQISKAPVAAMTTALQARSFAGIAVDRWGYDDGGKVTEASIAASVGGSAPIVSPDGRYAFYQFIR
jgi:phosphoglycerol transferase